MKRRAFLGFLGGAAVSGPTVAKAAAADMSSLALIPGAGDMPDQPMGYASASGSNSLAKEALKRFLGKTAEQIAYEKRHYHVAMLDPNVGSLRSVALRHKIEMSRAIGYAKRERLEEANLRGHIKGWWS